MKIMKRLYSYLIERFIGPFILTFFVCIFVLLMQFLWQYLDYFVGKGLETSVIIELMYYAALRLVPMALPLSVLMASIITFGNLGERFELLAIKASGVSLLKIMKPLIIFNIVVTMFAFFMASEIIPVTNAKFYALLFSVKEQRPEIIIKEGAFSNDIDGYSIKVNKVDRNNGALLGVMIYDHTEGNGNVNITLADSGFLNISADKHYMILTLYRGESYTDVKESERVIEKTFPFRRERFEKEEIIINVKDFNLKRADENFYKDGIRMLKNRMITRVVDTLEVLYNERVKLASTGIMYNSQLNENIHNHFSVDSLENRKLSEVKIINYNFDNLYSLCKDENKVIVLNTAILNAQANQRNVLQNVTVMYEQQKLINRYIIEFNLKYTFSLTCLIFFLIGAPLGAIIRKGGFGMPVVVSILLFISYYIVSMIGENMAREGVLKVGGAIWFSTILFFFIGIFLTHQAITDSMLLNTEIFDNIIIKLKFLKFLNPKMSEKESDDDIIPIE
jgi:lipopolysaccharide export system permease protein